MIFGPVSSPMASTTQNEAEKPPTSTFTPPREWSPSPTGLRSISLNTTFCYKKSFFNYANTHDTDPLGEIQWLIHQLQAAEDAGKRVWIIAHVGPSMTDCLRS
ncbi:hypothetical protein BGZ92_005635 [Podila epicladia]|nr:hypothetical protein BGZ92_005635 [Podila epicladia]